jgi:hypothetical protein
LRWNSVAACAKIEAILHSRQLGNTAELRLKKEKLGSKVCAVPRKILLVDADSGTDDDGSKRRGEQDEMD